MTVSPLRFSEGFDRKKIIFNSGLYGAGGAMFTIDVNTDTDVEEE